jgi:hypothetical protein
VVAQRLAQPGERVAVDARLIEVINLNQTGAGSGFARSRRRQLRAQVGMKAQLEVEGVEEPVAAKVLRINPSSPNRPAAVSLVYLGMQGREGLRQGLFAGSAWAHATPASRWLCPLSSVRTDKPQPYVQVMRRRASRACVGANRRPAPKVNGKTWP